MNKDARDILIGIIASLSALLIVYVAKKILRYLDVAKFIRYILIGIAQTLSVVLIMHVAQKIIYVAQKILWYLDVTKYTRNILFALFVVLLAALIIYLVKKIFPELFIMFSKSWARLKMQDFKIKFPSSETIITTILVLAAPILLYYAVNRAMAPPPIPVPVPIPPPPKLEVAFYAQRNGSQPERIDSRSGPPRLTKEDDFYLEAKATEGGYLYVYHKDSAGRIRILFPDRVRGNPAPNGTLRIPDTPILLKVDEFQKGHEEISVFLSRHQDAELEKICGWLRDIQATDETIQMAEDSANIIEERKRASENHQEIEAVVLPFQHDSPKDHDHSKVTSRIGSLIKQDVEYWNLDEAKRKLDHLPDCCRVWVRSNSKGAVPWVDSQGAAIEKCRCLWKDEQEAKVRHEYAAASRKVKELGKILKEVWSNIQVETLEAEKREIAALRGQRRRASSDGLSGGFAESGRKGLRLEKRRS